MGKTISTDWDLNKIFSEPSPFEMDLPWGDYEFSRRFLKVVNDWGIPTDSEIAFLNQYLPKSGGSALDLASGGGRHAVGLARCGHQITAVEIGRYPVQAAERVAKKENLNINFVVDDIRKIEYSSVFDMGFLICGQIGHFSPGDCRIIFRNSSKAVKQDGYFIVHLISFTGEDCSNYVQWYKEKEPFYFDNPSIVHREQYYIARHRVKIIRDFAVDTVTRQNRLFGISEKLYTEMELVEFANEFSLKLVEKYGSYDKEPLSRNSKSQIFVFKKG